MSMLDEELVVSDDSDFEDLFPAPSKNDADEEIDAVIEDEEYEVEEAPKKKRGRPAKAASEKKPAAAKKKKVEEEEAPAPKKRGRPAKKVVAVVEEEEEEPAPVVKKGRKKKEEPAVVEEVDVFDEEETEPIEVVEKKPRAKRVSVDDLSPDILDKIYEEYSQRPAAELAEELNLPEKKIHKAISRMKELFEMSISTGDLSEDDYSELVLPKLEAYQEPKDCFDAYVRNTVKNIKKNKK